MKWITILLLIGIIYGTTNQQLYSSEAKHKVEDPRVAKVARFLDSYHSPLSYLAKDFVTAADANKLDYRLLPTISCAESSCGKNYHLNAFGWGSDTIDFGSDADDIRGIAHQIATLHYYKVYRQSGRLYDFALAYNGEYADSYYQKLEYFWGKLEDYEES